MNENQKQLSAKIPICQEDCPLFAGMMKLLHSTMLNYPRKRNSHEGPERKTCGYAHLVSQHNQFLASTNVPFFYCCSTEWSQRNPNNHNQYRWRFAACFTAACWKFKIKSELEYERLLTRLPSKI